MFNSIHLSWLIGTLQMGLFGNDWAVGQALILNSGKPPSRDGFHGGRDRGQWA
jgi:hypothetical protein